MPPTHCVGSSALFGCVSTSPEFQHGCVGLHLEPPNVLDVRRQGSDELCRCAIADTEPHDLGRCSVEQTQPMEVPVLRDQYTVVLAGQVPYVRVGSATPIEETNMERARKHDAELSHERL